MKARLDIENDINSEPSAKLIESTVTKSKNNSSKIGFIASVKKLSNRLISFVKKHPILTAMIIAMLIAATVFTAGAILIPAIFGTLATVGIIAGTSAGVIAGIAIGNNVHESQKAEAMFLFALVGGIALYGLATVAPIVAVVLLGSAITALFGAIGAGIGAIIKHVTNHKKDKKTNVDINNENSYVNSCSKLIAPKITNNNTSLMKKTRHQSLGDISSIPLIPIQDKDNHSLEQKNYGKKNNAKFITSKKPRSASLGAISSVPLEFKHPVRKSN